MSTATAGPQAVPSITERQLPIFEGFRIRTARVAFGGAWEFPLSGAEDVAFAEALKMGREMTVTIAVDGHEREVVLGARVTGRGYKFRKQDGDELTLTRYQVTINHQRPEDEEGGE